MMQIQQRSLHRRISANLVFDNLVANHETLSSAKVFFGEPYRHYSSSCGQERATSGAAALDPKACTAQADSEQRARYQYAAGVQFECDSGAGFAVARHTRTYCKKQKPE